MVSVSFIHRSILNVNAVGTSVAGIGKVLFPYGAEYNGSSSVNGAFKITLPQTWTNTMMSMKIVVFEYATNESFEISCGGYTYTGSGGTWVNTHAKIIASGKEDRNFNIRFGHDGTKCCIYIGETTTNWSYPKVVVTEWIGGHAAETFSNWDNGWAISAVTSLGTITSTESNSQIGRYQSIVYDVNDTGYYTNPASTSNLNQLDVVTLNVSNDGAGSGLDADLLDGVQASQFLRSDATDTATGNLTFTGIVSLNNNSNEYSGHLYYNPLDADGNHYPHFRDGSNANGVNINWRLYSGASLITHTWNYTDTNFVNSLRSTSDMRAPIFYDTDNTGYYLNPAGSSILNGPVVIKGNDNQLAIDGNVGALASGLFFRESGTNKYELYHYSGEFRFYNYTTNQQEMSINNAGGYITSRTSFRAPIFYDSDNTGYYVDPAGISNLSQSKFLAGISVNSGSSSATKHGISLYGTQTTGMPAYGLAFTGTAGEGTHGSVTSDWATYFTMSGSTSRGWIFKHQTNRVASISGTGNASFNGDVIAYFSDMRLKTKLGNIENPIQKIQSLNGFYYEPNEVAESYGYKKERKLGLSAQEVEAILPEIVTDAPIGDGYKTVDYAKLVPVLIEAIKEQQKQIDELKQLINK